MPTDKPRITIVVDDDLLTLIDDFRFDNRYPSRSAAILDLLQRGIKQIEQEKNQQ